MNNQIQNEHPPEGDIAALRKEVQHLTQQIERLLELLEVIAGGNPSRQKDIGKLLTRLKQREEG